MHFDPKCPLLVKPDFGGSVYQDITPQGAGWKLLNFNARRLDEKANWKGKTADHELLVVILSGNIVLESSRGNWEVKNGRKSVFSGFPYAVYLPRNTFFNLTSTSGVADVACGHCETDQDHPAQFITPEDVEEMGVEIRGGDNATRQINRIMPPGSDCHRLICVEVYTPSGNWSSFPPHKHDERKVSKDGKLLEACLEETYFYKFDKPQGFGIQRVYTDDRSLDEVAVVQTDDTMLVKKGYHPFVAGHGYNAYYLNFLVGSDQALNATDDPDHKWIYGTWTGKDPRVPMLKTRGRTCPA